ncbi:phosphotransferase [Candidatus Bathyarchaeota archaeon]|nr:phosphotransferase [Candidatus Bathyarchaeota archaeon]
MAEGLETHGPYSNSAAYFGAIADAAIGKLESDAGVSWAALGAFVFRDIVRSTTLYADGDGRFPLNHMDLGTQNILVDDELNFLAIIDWEFAQTAPWAVNHYPMPFPLLKSDGEIRDILRDPEHLAHRNVSRQESARKLYVQGFRDAEAGLRGRGGCSRARLRASWTVPRRGCMRVSQVLGGCWRRMRVWYGRWCGLRLTLTVSGRRSICVRQGTRQRQPALASYRFRCTEYYSSCAFLWGSIAIQLTIGVLGTLDMLKY